MANATVSFLGQTNSSGDANALFLKVFAGEVLASFQRQNKMLPLTTVRSISQGKSAQFPLVGLASAEYHTAGAEINGTAIKHAERVITIDDLLISHAFISNIDEAKNHYDVRSIYSQELGSALAKKLDQNLIQLAVLGARAGATVTGIGAANAITDSDAHTNASSFVDSIYEAAQIMDENDVPDDDRYCVMTPDQYYLALTNDKSINRDFGGTGNFQEGSILRIAGMNIVKSNSAVSAFTDLSSASTTGQNNTYRGNFSTTVAVCFHKSAVGTVKLLDLAMETE
ncbi:MAG: hypothetical protein CBC04_08635, partial [Verrucomicrobia bacterium TMED44]